MILLQKECVVSASPFPQSTTPSLPSFIRITLETKESKRTLCPKWGQEANNVGIYTEEVASREEHP